MTRRWPVTRSISIALQLVVIVGSLSATALTALAEEKIPKEVAVAVTFAVGVAASCSLTFRPRERGALLQQIAADIEREYWAAELSIGDYAAASDGAARLRMLATRVQTMRADQATRERDLEQPPDPQQPATPGADAV